MKVWFIVKNKKDNKKNFIVLEGKSTGESVNIFLVDESVKDTCQLFHPNEEDNINLHSQWYIMCVFNRARVDSEF